MDKAASLSILDSLLSELGPAKPAKPKRIQVNMTTKRASGTDLYEGQGEEGEIDLAVQRMLAENSWHSEARVVLVVHQECLCCSNSISSVEGLFLRQRRREATRRVAQLHFTELDLNQFPLELEEFHREVQHCFNCLSTEILAEQVLAGRRQLGFAFSEGYVYECDNQPVGRGAVAAQAAQLDSLIKELDLEVLPEGSIDALLLGR